MGLLELSNNSMEKTVIEALAAIVFRLKERRKTDEPVFIDRRKKTFRQVSRNLRDSIDRFSEAVERRNKETQ